MKRTTIAKAAVLLAALALGAGYFALYMTRATQKGKATPVAVAPVPVTLAQARRGAFPVWIESIGVVQALNTVVVKSRIDGQIDQILFKEGETVKAGDVLTRLDSRPYQAALAQATAKKQQDAATLNNARLDLQRYQKLASQSFATEQQLDTQRAAVASGEALAAADQAAIDNAATQLSYAEIHAPISGRIGFRQVDAGNIVHASDTALLSIVQVDPIVVQFSIPEDRVFEAQRAMRAGALKVEARTTDRDTDLAEGVVTVINNQVDQGTGTVQVKASFDNADLRLWPGQSVVARLHVRDIADAIILPDAAIQHAQSGLFVWFIHAQGKASMRKVAVERSEGGRSVVGAGVAEGDTVVTGGASRLRDKAKTTATAPPAEGVRQSGDIPVGAKGAAR